MDLQQDIYLPALRQDLQIYKGGYDLDGSPTWMIYDPLSDNYFKIGWFEFECLQRFETCATGSELAKAINKETSLSVTLEDVRDFAGFMAVSGLLIANSKEMRKLLKDRKSEQKPPLLQYVFRKYIYAHFPLFKPDPFLRTVYPFIAPLFTKVFFTCVIALLFFGLYLTIQRWDEFLFSFTNFLSLEGLIMVFVTTAFIKVFHELGHAFMAHKHGVPVSSMGVAFIVMYPILFTETTNAWRLFSRPKRIQIAAAGLMAELTLASFALIFWHMASPGVGQNIAYFVAFLSLIISVAINMNPLLKFDGYYLLSDFAGIDNLQSRAVFFFKWKLRDVLLGYKDEAPEIIAPKTARFLIFFGLALAIYRFFLYLGIAALIYLFVFKPLGFILAVLTVFVFVGLPILSELAFWWREREDIMKNTKFRVLALIVLGLVVWAFLPVQNTIKIPAVYHAGQYTSVYTPIAARIVSIEVENEDQVEEGDILYRLESDNLEKAIKEAQLNLKLYNKIKSRQQASRELSKQVSSIEQLILEAKVKLAGLKEQEKKLTIRAPFSGTVKGIVPEYHPGRWVNQSDALALIINSEKHGVTGYIASEQLGRLIEDPRAVFKPDAALFYSFDIKLEEVASSSAEYLNYPELSSPYGGSIAADQEGDQIRSKSPVYAVNFSAPQDTLKNDFTKKGIVVLEVQPISFTDKILKKLFSVFIRETGI